MGLKRIRLELARNPAFPSGSRSHGYEFVAPLDDDGHLDAVAWKMSRDACVVHRFWGHDTQQHGHLIRRPGGSWAFDYDSSSSDDDETGFKFDKHRFVAGEYVSITEHDGQQFPFHVISMRDAD